MPRLRSVLVVALMWLSAFAASSAPDGFFGTGPAASSIGGDPSSGDSMEGKRWAVTVDPAGKRWDGFEDLSGKRWS
jgi:hypothetical protein